MIDEKKKMTAQDSSVGADDGQSISKNSDISITTSKEEINDEVVNPQESLESKGLRTMNLKCLEKCRLKIFQNCERQLNCSFID